MLRWLTGAESAPREVVMYTRQGCHLCDDAWALLERAAARHRLTLSKVDVDSDPAPVERYGLCVPVVVIDGQERFRGVVNAALLDRVLRSEV